mgnify:CR=1 FL=1
MPEEEYREIWTELRRCPACEERELLERKKTNCSYCDGKRAIYVACKKIDRETFDSIRGADDRD